MVNQNPEQIARDNIDLMLSQAVWSVQSKNKVNLSESQGVAVREYQTDVGPADYVLFVDRKPIGVIEAKREEEGQRLTEAEDQAHDYAQAKLKYNLNKEPLYLSSEKWSTVFLKKQGKYFKKKSLVGRLKIKLKMFFKGAK